MRITVLWFLVIAGILAASCAGLRKKDRPEYDMMDNLTSRFNIIYHGKEIIAEAEKENLQAYKLNYYDLLPVFIEPDEASVSRHSSLMDSVQGKAKRVIDEKAKSRFTDDAYFLMAQANYLKGNYHQAAAFFAYVANIYPEAKKQRQMAWIGQIRSLMQLGAFAETAPVWDSVFTYLDDHKRTRAQVYATRANFYLKQGNEREAISYLAQALKLRGDRMQKLRWHFLIGQLLERQGENAEAARHYQKVARSNASYEMAFQAALNRTFLITAAGVGEKENKVKALNRMLRDDKNKDFKDQIHYYIAETYAQAGDPEGAIEHYNLALRQPTGNRHQATMTYLSLADLYMDQSEFEKARNYYDSTATVLPMDFMDAAGVRRKIMQMDRLITNKQVVARQDSLQTLATLDPAQREAAIDQIIEKQYGQLIAERAAAEQEAESLSSKAGRRSQTQPSYLSPFDQAQELPSSSAYTDNRFYFNNPDAVGMGISAFRRRWGNRPEQDNWRWSESPQQLGTQPNAGTGEVSEILPDDPTTGHTPEIATTPLSWQEDLLKDSTAFAEWVRQDLLAHIPTDGEALQASQTLIQSALAQNGEIYRFNLRDYPASVQTYESLIARFPQDEQTASWYFNLYQLHQAAGQQAALIYRDRILSNYPQSIYSKIILDPEYLQKLAEEKQRANELYERLYAHYVKEEFQEIIRAVNQTADNAQLAYLRALAIGRTADVSAFQGALQQLAEQFPADSLITPLVRQHLVFMEQHPAEFEGREIALSGRAAGANRFLDEPGLTPWPQLVMSNQQRPRTTVMLTGTSSQTTLSGSKLPGVNSDIAAITSTPLGGNRTVQMREEQNTFRDTGLLPDSATYFFVIHVMHPTANLAPSRFGIGQFNRGRYPDAAISHQLKQVNNESQLVFIGPFYTFQETKIYEARFLPLIGEIMKIPADVYQTFIVTESVFGTLSDFGKIDDYYQFYISQ